MKKENKTPGLDAFSGAYSVIDEFWMLFVIPPLLGLVLSLLLGREQ